MDKSLSSGYVFGKPFPLSQCWIKIYSVDGAIQVLNNVEPSGEQSMTKSKCTNRTITLLLYSLSTPSKLTDATSWFLSFDFHIEC